MKAIQTKYHGPTERSGARITARADGGSVRVPYDHALDGAGNHRAAAERLCFKMGWKGEIVGGQLPDGSHAWVFVGDHAYTLAEIRNGTGWAAGVRFVIASGGKP